MNDDILVVTSENIAGYKVTKTLGEVFGLTSRSRNLGSDIGQGLKSLVGGEVKGYTKLQQSARDEALARLRDEARNKGANAVIMFRFDTTSTQVGDSVTAYGTAVYIEAL
ncbi:hypothetical protein WOSG25_140380 [Weissella oryzae SG25]|uniref:UPF0145 protein WOSG25_140380 n=1 Tax=Weissella oryzae (strain DSM 25784 / JCM 18191 / LMG 30913 / SG25) TaxID=1329250 RepID=A0A069D2V3_WEIOS|nr:heavy metal-binding domain-containing protein [Weissella oryzae]GAK31736.1 hypothetical protein WOSG25_140380 [Weissella oryzae SG25]